MGRKAVGPVCCVTHVKEPSALIEKRRGSPRCSWFDWQHIAPQHLVNHYMVLCKRSRSHNSNVVPHTLQENTECWSALSVTEWRICTLYKKPLLLLLLLPFGMNWNDNGSITKCWKMLSCNVCLLVCGVLFVCLFACVCTCWFVCLIACHDCSLVMLHFSLLFCHRLFNFVVVGSIVCLLVCLFIC